MVAKKQELISDIRIIKKDIRAKQRTIKNLEGKIKKASNPSQEKKLRKQLEGAEQLSSHQSKSLKIMKNTLNVNKKALYVNKAVLKLNHRKEYQAYRDRQPQQTSSQKLEK